MTQTEFLLDGVKYYAEDTNRRCTLRGELSSKCFYSPKSANKLGVSKGCMIGRVLPKRLQAKLDKQDNTGLPDVYHLLPSDIQSLGKTFLSECQQLHDRSDYWNKEGISEEGQYKLSGIISKYSLDAEQFKEFLKEK